MLCAHSDQLMFLGGEKHLVHVKLEFIKNVSIFWEPSFTVRYYRVRAILKGAIVLCIVVRNKILIKYKKG